MDVCLTSFSPDGVETSRAPHVEELIQVTVSAFGQLQNQAAVSRTFNVNNGRMSLAFRKGAEKIDFLEGWKAPNSSHKKHAKPHQDGIAIGV